MNAFGTKRRVLYGACGTEHVYVGRLGLWVRVRRWVQEPYLYIVTLPDCFVPSTALAVIRTSSWHAVVTAGMLITAGRTNCRLASCESVTAVCEDASVSPCIFTFT